jgi:hypothetical protein
MPSRVPRDSQLNSNVQRCAPTPTGTVLLSSTTNDFTRNVSRWLLRPDIENHRKKRLFERTDRSPPMTVKTKRTLLIASIVTIAVLAAFLIAIQIRRHSAPEAVRLLPQADGIVYFDVKTVRRLTGYKPGNNPHDPEYQRFIDATGFEPERDLDEVAIGIHSSQSHETRFSYVFIGHFDFGKVSNYLKQVSRDVERYRDMDIYQIPVENRTVRVALLGLDMAAISNVDDASVLRGIIDRSKERALPFGGPGLVQDYYKHVPIGSLAWGLMRIPPAPKDPRQARNLSLPGGIDIFVPSSSTMVASVRFITSLDFKAEFFTASEEDAKHFVEQAQTFLALFQSIQSSAQLSGSDPDVKAVFASFHFEQQKDRAILTADIPLGFINKIFNEPPTQISPEEQKPAETPQSAPKSNTKRKSGKK